MRSSRNWHGASLGQKLAAAAGLVFLHAPVWVIVLLIAGLILSVVFHKKISLIRVCLQGSALAWIIMLLLLQRPNAWSKIWIFLLPLVILWAVAGIFGLLGLFRMKAVPIPAILLAVLMAAAGYHAITLLPQLPGLWHFLGDEESAVLFVKSGMTSADGLVVAPPDDAPVWYYAERHGISEALSRADESDQWYVLVNPGEGQTTASVMEERGPEVRNSLACEPMDDFGKIIVYKCRETP